MMLIDNKFEIEQVVYLKTDEDQKARIITSINIRKREISYELSCGTESNWHYDYEILTEKNVVALN